MAPSGRHFTILDFLVLTVVMAGAALAARSEAFVTAEHFGRVVDHIRAGPGGFINLFPTPAFPRGQSVPSPPTLASCWEQLAGLPDSPSQLRSVRLVLLSSVKNTVVPDTMQILWSWPGDRGCALFLLRQCVVLLFPVLAGLSFALLLLRMVPPRPAWPELARQPGIWACLATMGALFGTFWVEELWETEISMTALGAAVAVPWLGLALSRRWRAEKSWIDRAGRIVGVGWLLAGALAVG